MQGDAGVLIGGIRPSGGDVGPYAGEVGIKTGDVGGIL